MFKQFFKNFIIVSIIYLNSALNSNSKRIKKKSRKETNTRIIGGESLKPLEFRWYGTSGWDRLNGLKESTDAAPVSSM
jgi:hypothetical protein